MLRHHKPMVEFEHHWLLKENTSYINKTVKEQRLKGLSTIILDPNKLKMKVYTGTTCRLFDRNGDPLTIRVAGPTEYLSYGLTGYVIEPKIVTGHSKPHFEDRFNKYDGRKFALLNALNKLIFTKKDRNFEDLLFHKKFLKTYELRDNIDSVSWEFADLWQALVDLDKAKETDNDVEETLICLFDKAKKFSGEDLYDIFEAALLEFISSWDSYKDSYGLDLNTAYYSYKLLVRDFVKNK